MAGTIGAAITPTGTPAALSSRIASSLRGGVAARGSILRAAVRSSVVTEMATLTRPRSAILARISLSRTTSADLVTIPTGWLAASSTSSTARVMRCSRSIGW